MLMVIGQARAREGKIDALIKAAAEVAHATSADPGCERYTFAVDVTRADTMVSVEVWRDRAALDDHLEHDHTQAFMAAVGDLVDGEPTMQVFTATLAPAGVRP